VPAREQNADRLAAPAELVQRGLALVKAYPKCFWFRHPEAEIVYMDDLRLVVEHLREYGDHRAWNEAQELHKCLLPLSNKTF
jgi:hypothetical protein